MPATMLVTALACGCPIFVAACVRACVCVSVSGRDRLLRRDDTGGSGGRGMQAPAMITAPTPVLVMAVAEAVRVPHICGSGGGRRRQQISSLRV